MLNYKLSQCEESETGAKVEKWLGYHGHLLPVTGFANHLIFFMAPALQ